MSHRKRTTWYERQQKRKTSPFLRRIDRSFRFRLVLASTSALLLLGGLDRAETCRANHYSSNCLFLDAGSILSVSNLESYSIATASLLYLLESERRHEQTNREAFETILATGQNNLVYSLARIKALETLSDAGCVMDGLDLHGANLELLQVPETRLRKINLSSTVLINADLRDCDLTDANLTDADLTRANLTGVNLTDADLTRANLTGVNLTDADLTRANLTGVNLTDADLTRANLTGINLTDADLTHANLTDVNLTDAVLVRTKLDGSMPGET